MSPWSKKADPAPLEVLQAKSRIRDVLPPSPLLEHMSYDLTKSP